MDCCTVYSEEFDREAALADAQRYRRRGLDRLSRAVRDRVIAHGVGDARVLEIGGGVGALSIELLESGAAAAVNVELSRSYRDAALALAFEAGVENRFSLVAGDGAEFEVEPGDFDVVLLNRVVCCYRDARRLLDSAAAATGRMLVVTHPTIHPMSRAVIWLGNLLRARRGSPFRTFVHPMTTIGRPVTRGLVALSPRIRPVWTLHAWERPGG